tara:strand:+ start:3471 stop:4661 length:1191 start_codon:yes stop_codon:yes gene_type:complete
MLISSVPIAAICTGVAVTLFYSASYYLFPALLNFWLDTLSISKNNLTFAFSLSLFVQAFAFPFYGRLIDRGYGLILILICPIMIGLSLLYLSYAAELYIVFLSGWISVNFFAAGCTYNMVFSIITMAEKKDTRRTIIIITLIAGFASTITFPIMTYFASTHGWKLAIMIIGISIIIIGTPMLYAGMKNYVIVEVPKKLQNNHKIFLPIDSKLLLLSLPFFLIALNHQMLVSHIIPLLLEKGLEFKMAIIIASLFGPFQVVGRMIILFFGEKISDTNSLFYIFYMTVISLLFLYVTHISPTLAFIFILLEASAYGITSIILPLISKDVLGMSDFGQKFGYVSVFYAIGLSCGPWIGSLIWTNSNYDFVIIFIILSSIIGLLICYLLKYKYFKSLPKK